MLEAAYGDSGRGYHGWSHISDLFEALDQVSELATRRDLVATAIFWHDAVYDTRAANGTRRADAVNVLDSAELFGQHSLLSVADADAVHKLIIATTDHLGAKTGRDGTPGLGRTSICSWTLTSVPLPRLGKSSPRIFRPSDMSSVGFQNRRSTRLRAPSLKPSSPMRRNCTAARDDREMAEKGAREHRALLGRPQSEPRSLTQRRFDDEDLRSKAREPPLAPPEVCNPPRGACCHSAK